MKNPEYIEKWLNETLTEDERRLFEQTAEFRSLQKLSNALVAYKAPEYDAKAEFNRLQARKAVKHQAKLITLPWLQTVIKIAAVLAISLGIYFYYFSTTATTLSTLTAEKTALYLPDSSLVTLNASSSLTYYKRRWSKQRTVTLDGEAFFKVAKGSRFDVQTEAGVVSVLGTQFNVKKRKNYFEVICYEGLVQVNYSGKILQLTPSKMFRLIDGNVTALEATQEVVPGWTRNESFFESVPFSEVLDEIERQYSVTIVTKNIDKSQLFTGRFPHDNLTLALKSITVPLHLSYEVTSKKVVLSREIQ